jgi:hypothetical protein
VTCVPRISWACTPQQLIPLAGLLLQRHLSVFAAPGLWLVTGAYVAGWVLLARFGMPVAL